MPLHGDQEFCKATIWPVLSREKDERKQILVHTRNQTPPDLPFSIKVTGPPEERWIQASTREDLVRRLEAELKEKILRYRMTVKENLHLEWCWQAEPGRGGWSAPFSPTYGLVQRTQRSKQTAPPLEGSWNYLGYEQWYEGRGGGTQLAPQRGPLEHRSPCLQTNDGKHSGFPISCQEEEVHKARVGKRRGQPLGEGKPLPTLKDRWRAWPRLPQGIDWPAGRPSNPWLMTERPLTIISLNVRGLGKDSNKQKLIKAWLTSLQNPSQILLIQEHHLDK